LTEEKKKEYDAMVKKSDQQIKELNVKDLQISLIVGQIAKPE
jgi:hypothetical protein